MTLWDVIYKCSFILFIIYITLSFFDITICTNLPVWFCHSQYHIILFMSKLVVVVKTSRSFITNQLSSSPFEGSVNVTSSKMCIHTLLGPFWFCKSVSMIMPGDCNMWWYPHEAYIMASFFYTIHVYSNVICSILCTFV